MCVCVCACRPVGWGGSGGSDEPPTSWALTKLALLEREARVVYQCFSICITSHLTGTYLWPPGGACIAGHLMQCKLLCKHYAATKE